MTKQKDEIQPAQAQPEKKKKRPYVKPRIESRERLESVAAVCEPPIGKGAGCAISSS